MTHLHWNTRPAPQNKVLIIKTPNGISLGYRNPYEWEDWLHDKQQTEVTHWANVPTYEGDDEPESKPTRINWKATKLQTPPEDTLCLVIKNSRITLAFHYEGTWEDYLTGDMLYRVTHWAPIEHEEKPSN